MLYVFNIRKNYCKNTVKRPYSAVSFSLGWFSNSRRFGKRRCNGGSYALKTEGAFGKNRPFVRCPAN